MSSSIFDQGAVTSGSWWPGVMARIGRHLRAVFDDPNHALSAAAAVHPEAPDAQSWIGDAGRTTEASG